MTYSKRSHITLALNALGAFVDIQNMIDAQPGRMQFEKPEGHFEGVYGV